VIERFRETYTAAYEHNDAVAAKKIAVSEFNIIDCEYAKRRGWYLNWIGPILWGKGGSKVVFPTYGDADEALEFVVNEARLGDPIASKYLTHKARRALHGGS
jgi:hypothetical protein